MKLSTSIKKDSNTIKQINKQNKKDKDPQHMKEKDEGAEIIIVGFFSAPLFFFTF